MTRSVTSNPDSLEKCFVTTEARTKYDSTLGMHLADPKPKLIESAKRIRTGKEPGPLESIVDISVLDHAPPVTLIIGPVGAGKSTYLKHFEIVSGKDVLQKRDAHWIYIDFEEMGISGEPREFLYKKLRDYLLDIVSDKKVVEAAYEDTIQGMARGPFAVIADDKTEFNKRIADYIQDEYQKVEPYVDRIFQHLIKKNLCVVVLDNSDLYENEELEKKVFAEGLALSKRLKSYVIVSLRDSTFIKHRNSAAFDAFELRKLWLDPPPFKSVLSKRLNYSRKILKGKKARIATAKGMWLDVPDLGAFFEIVQQSVLAGQAGDYIDSMSDQNIRRGLEMITNFLTSGHIQADRALRIYMDENSYQFPFHEVFKGTALGQWKHYKEKRAECINLFDSLCGAKRIRLLRLGLISHLHYKAQSENTLEVPVKECISLFLNCGASEQHILDTLRFLQKKSVLRTVSTEEVTHNDRIVITRSGGYYLKKLSHTFVYVEQCMADTAIEDPAVWSALSDLTYKIEFESNISKRMELRRERIGIFLDYLQDIEFLMLNDISDLKHIKLIEPIRSNVEIDVDDAVNKTLRYHGVD